MEKTSRPWLRLHKLPKSILHNREVRVCLALNCTRPVAPSVLAHRMARFSPWASKRTPGCVRTGLRLIYAFDADEDCIELIEIYVKADKETEDRDRIKNNHGASKGSGS